VKVATAAPFIALLLAAGLILPARAADDAAAEKLQARAEACIRGHAAEVEAASASLTDAAGFLTADLCAPHIAALAKYRQSTAMLATMRAATLAETSVADQTDPQLREMARKQLEQARTAFALAKVDPATGELRVPETPTSGLLSAYGALYTLGDDPIPADLKGLAATAILDARRARLGGQGGSRGAG
jgi:hypothetical protein